MSPGHGMVGDTVKWGQDHRILILSTTLTSYPSRAVRVDNYQHKNFNIQSICLKLYILSIHPLPTLNAHSSSNDMQVNCNTIGDGSGRTPVNIPEAIGVHIGAGFPGRLRALTVFQIDGKKAVGLDKAALDQSRGRITRVHGVPEHCIPARIDQ